MPDGPESEQTMPRTQWQPGPCSEPAVCSAPWRAHAKSAASSVPSPIWKGEWPNHPVSPCQLG